MEARKKTYDLHKDRTNTWAAYQCYGDPSYRLVEISASGATGHNPFEDIEEAITAVRQWRGRAQTTAVEGRAYLQEKAAGLLKRIEDESADWLEDSRLQEALGELFGEVYMFDKAIEYYQKALENQHCNASIKTIEQLANFRIRMAVKDLEPHPEHYEKSKKVIKKDLATLKTLTKTLKETPERLSLIGSAHKRLALISANQEPDVCEQALEDMDVAYCRAWEMGGRKKLYPLTNHLTATLVRQLRSGTVLDGKIPSELLNLAAQAKKLAENDRLNARDEFWAGIGYTDVKVLEYLIDSLRPDGRGLSEERVKNLLDEYMSTWKRYGSPREMNSIIENYHFLTKVLHGKDVSKQLEDIGTELSLLTKI
jgi:tetratricopeptide (TPR) repeat protein